MSRPKLVDTIPLKHGQLAYPVLDGKTLWLEPTALYAMAWPVVDYSYDERGGALTVRESGALTSQEPREFVILDEDLPEGTVLYAS